MEQQEKKLVAAQIQIENQFKSGASWFFWIAGLSLVNSAALFSGSSWHFIIGLSITQFIDAVAKSIHGPYAPAFLTVALMMDLGFASLFVLLGIWAKQKSGTAFILGIILYGFDTVMLLFIGSIIGIIFHVLALVFIFRGYQSLRKLDQHEAAAPSTASL